MGTRLALSAVMLKSKWWMVTLVGLAGLGCADGDADDDALVRGQVVRTDTATSYGEGVALGSDSVARISLYSNPALGGDGTSTLLVEQVISPAPALPFEFELNGPRPDEASRDQYHIVVEIKQHTSTATVGDFVSETMNIVEPPADDVVIEVGGLESCDAPNAGGFCL
jgi:hypothetical protein